MKQVLLVAMLTMSPVAGAVAGADEPVVTLTIKDHRFDPATLTVPAGVRLRIDVQNLDATAEEFESTGLHAEKIVVGGGHSVVRVGPLQPGRYAFGAEYHPEAKGELVAVAP